MKQFLYILSITTLTFISSCRSNVLCIDRSPIGYFLFEFINDTECDCWMSWEDDFASPQTIQIKPGDTYIQKKAVGGSNSNIPFLIETRPLTITFTGGGNYSFSLDEHFSWTALPHTEELIGASDEYNTTYRFYMSDILALNPKR